MKTYIAILRVTPWSNSKPYTTSTTISGVKNIHEAVELATDSEGGDWDYKRSHKEVISIIKVEP